MCCCVWYVLGFKSEVLNPEHKEINVKVRNMKVFESENKKSGSSNKCFHISVEGSLGVYL
jgi:hypothetical protein